MKSDLCGYAVLANISNCQIEVIARTLFTDVIGGLVRLSRMAIVRRDNVVSRIDRSVIGEEYAMRRVVGRPGSVINGVSGYRVVGRSVQVNSMTSASEDVIASYHVTDRGTASVIESDALVRRPCDRVSGDDIVLGDV